MPSLDHLHRTIPALMIALLFAAGFPALDQYNVTWDEALGDLFFGERYLSFFTTLDPAYLDFDADPYPPERRPDLSLSPFKVRPWEYYPFANTLAAATSTVLARWLGWLDPFDGFHAVNLFLAAILVWVLFRFLAPRLGLVAATVAVGLLFTSPRIVCHLMANIKDFPLMVLFAVTAVVFFRAYEAGSVRGLVGAGALWGLALATKANALFFPCIPMALLILGRWPAAWRGRRTALALGLLGAAAVGVAVMVAVWPYLWADPVGHFREHLEYIGFRKGFTRPESIAPVFEAVLFTTPPVFLTLFGIGLVPALRRAWKRDRLALFLLAWVATALGRYVLPQAVNFDGVRHFLELFPAMAAIAGLGAAKIGKRFTASVPRHRQQLKAALLVVLLLPGSWQVLRAHPFQIAYWNVFAGGYAGARAANLPQAGDYWGMSYRLGLRWLNDNAPEAAFLAVPVIEHAVRLVASERLRPDIQLLPVTTPFSPRIAPERLAGTRELARQRPVYVMFVERRDWLNQLMVDCLRTLEPEAVWELEGAPVLSIYRYRWPLPG
ncbi:MAG: glycosyltransferase family 39 protein [Thermoanaerobaculia bacterium]